MKHALVPLLLALATGTVRPADPAPQPAAPEAAPPARIDITVHKGINKNKASTVSTQESYQFTVRLKNNEPTREFKGLTAELYVLGVDKSDESMFNLISRTTDVFDLPVRGEHEFTSNLFYVKYTNTSGSELGGYLLVLTDAEGKRAAVKSSRASFEKNLERIRTSPVSTSKKKAFRLE